jgi:hypothetical protein
LGWRISISNKSRIFQTDEGSLRWLGVSGSRGVVVVVMTQL